MKKTLTGTLLAIVAAAAWFVISLDDRIKSHIEKTGTTLAGVPVTIESLDLSLWSGTGTIAGLGIRNPEGFSDNNAFEMGLISVDVDMSSIFSQPLVVSEMVIDSTSIRLEFLENLGSNLQKNVNVSSKQNNAKDRKKKKKSGTEDDETAADQSAETDEIDGEEDEHDTGYLVRIEALRISETTFSVTKGDDSWSDTIAELEMNNLGKEKGISTRAIGIDVVTKLTRKTLSQAAKREINEAVKKKVEEAGSKLLESLLQQ